MLVKHSGLQRKVLSLYRQLLRVAVQKDFTISSDSKQTFLTLLQNTGRVDANSSPLTNTLRQKFRDNALKYDKTGDFYRIEHAIRQGEKWLKILRNSEVAGVTHLK